jgi:hypothetical protein
VNLEIRHVVVADEGGQEGRLVFRNGQLIAVLVLLSEVHDDLAGHWYVEAVFGALANYMSPYPAFKDLDAAQNWLDQYSGNTNTLAT